MDDAERLITAMGDLEEDDVLALVEDMLASDVEPLTIIDLCTRGLEIVGERYQKREYFLSGLIISDDIFRQVMDRLDRYQCFKPGTTAGLGKVILGAPLGDVHDIGKEIVYTLLRYSGFEVIDLGVSVKPSEFLEAAVEYGAVIVGISTLLTIAYESLRETVVAFEREGLRQGTKIMLGGGAVSQRVCDYVGADAWSCNALDAVKFAKEFVGKE
jgi:methylmalonyl-CoA mutase cobalamin-binding domain/chain